MTYPANLDALPTVVGNTTYEDDILLSHSSMHNNANIAINALENKIGIANSTVNTSHDYKLSGIVGTNKAASISGTETLTNKTLSSGSVIGSSVVVTEVLKKVYPVGSLYTNVAVATNPASLLGFGTWVAFGTGRVLVGVDSGQSEFDVLGETGGEKSHVLTTAELASHGHTASSSASSGVTDPGHDHVLKGYRWGTINDAYSGIGSRNESQYTPANDTNNGIQARTTGISVSTSVSTTVNANGSGSAHNNLQPYVTVYMWSRTA